MGGIRVVEQFPGHHVGGPAGHGHDCHLGVGTQTGGDAGAIHHRQARVAEHPVTAVTDPVPGRSSNAGRAQGVIGADQEVRGFQGGAQKAFQLGAVMDANDTIQTGNQHLFGTGIQIPAGQGMDAAFEQGKILSMMLSLQSVFMLYPNSGEEGV